MHGKRNQGVLHKYLMAAADELVVKGRRLGDRLFVPEPFSEAGLAASAQRRRDKLAVLQPSEGGSPLAVVIGELKDAEDTCGGYRVWIRHMPDAPLLVDAVTWRRIQRGFAAILEARDADGGRNVRIVMTALIRARRERTSEIDTASLMLASEHWIPVDGVDELALVQALVEQGRRFIKPLRYESVSGAAYPNALLLDAGPAPVPLHLVSAFMAPGDRAVKDAVIEAGGVWWSRVGEAMPALPLRLAPSAALRP